MRGLLKQSKVKTSSADTALSWTLLWWAARNGDEGVVWTLLERNGINSKRVDKRIREPLWWVTGNGHVDIVGPVQI